MLVVSLCLSLDVERMPRDRTMGLCIPCSFLASYVHPRPYLYPWTNLTRIQETYSNLSYIPPKCGNEPVILGGLVVTDNGFGIWNYTFPVTGGATPDSDGDCDGTKSKKSTSIKLSKENIWWGLNSVGWDWWSFLSCQPVWGLAWLQGLDVLFQWKRSRADFSCLLPTYVLTRIF